MEVLQKLWSSGKQSQDDHMLSSNAQTSQENGLLTKAASLNESIKNVYATGALQVLVEEWLHNPNRHAIERAEETDFCRISGELLDRWKHLLSALTLTGHLSDAYAMYGRASKIASRGLIGSSSNPTHDACLGLRKKLFNYILDPIFNPKFASSPLAVLQADATTLLVDLADLEFEDWDALYLQHYLLQSNPSERSLDFYLYYLIYKSPDKRALACFLYFSPTAGFASLRLDHWRSGITKFEKEHASTITQRRFLEREIFMLELYSSLPSNLRSDMQLSHSQIYEPFKKFQSETPIITSDMKHNSSHDAGNQHAESNTSILLSKNAKSPKPGFPPETPSGSSHPETHMEYLKKFTGAASSDKFIDNPLLDTIKKVRRVISEHGLLAGPSTAYDDGYMSGTSSVISEAIQDDRNFDSNHGDIDFPTIDSSYARLTESLHDAPSELSQETVVTPLASSSSDSATDVDESFVSLSESSRPLGPKNDPTSSEAGVAAGPSDLFLEDDASINDETGKKDSPVNYRLHETAKSFFLEKLGSFMSNILPSLKRPVSNGTDVSSLEKSCKTRRISPASSVEEFFNSIEFEGVSASSRKSSESQRMQHVRPPRGSLKIDSGHDEDDSSNSIPASPVTALRRTTKRRKSSQGTTSPSPALKEGELTKNRGSESSERPPSKSDVENIDQLEASDVSNMGDSPRIEKQDDVKARSRSSGADKRSAREVSADFLISNTSRVRNRNQKKEFEVSTSDTSVSGKSSPASKTTPGFVETDRSPIRKKEPGSVSASPNNSSPRPSTPLKHTRRTLSPSRVSKASPLRMAQEKRGPLAKSDIRHSPRVHKPISDECTVEFMFNSPKKVVKHMDSDSSAHKQAGSDDESLSSVSTAKHSARTYKHGHYGHGDELKFSYSPKKSVKNVLSSNPSNSPSSQSGIDASLPSSVTIRRKPARRKTDHVAASGGDVPLTPRRSARLQHH